MDHQQQVIRIDRLGEKIERAFLDGFDSILNRAVRGHDDDRQLGIQLFGRVQDAKAVSLGQAQIREHDAGPRGAHGLRRFAFVARFNHAVALRFKREAQHRSQRFFVFDEQNGRIGRLAGHWFRFGR